MNSMRITTNDLIPLWPVSLNQSRMIRPIELHVRWGGPGELNSLLMMIEHKISSLSDREVDTCVEETHRPLYYKRESGVEVIDVIEDWRLGFHLGNALKYIVREKRDRTADLEKARWYIQRYLFHHNLAPES